MIKAFEKALGKDAPYQIIDRRPDNIATCYADPPYAEKRIDWKAELELDEICKGTQPRTIGISLKSNFSI